MAMVILWVQILCKIRLTISHSMWALSFASCPPLTYMLIITRSRLTVIKAACRQMPNLTLAYTSGLKHFWPLMISFTLQLVQPCS